ncbi:MAG: AAA family ATPase [Betaproteobacteria bacterium]|nr:AAA family ATPase [Betaproteobacteria bacterium]
MKMPVQPISQVERGAERRPLSILFCDLVESSQLAARLDPEDLREVYSRVARRVSEVARSFDGFVAEYPGDATLVYFGYPYAHENDAECAIRAALQLVEELQTLVLAEDYAPRVRVGIATGLVVVGADDGANGTELRHAAGQTPNIASRLQHLAQPGEVVIDDSTRRLTGRLFDYANLGVTSLRGLPDMQVWRVLGPAFVESRFEAQRAGQLGPLVGRAAEQSRLAYLWREAAGGAGRVVLLSAEAGVGKSRLVASLLDSLADETLTRIRYFCSPHLKDSPLHPVIQQLQRSTRIERKDPDDVKLQRLGESLLAPREGELELFASLLGIPGAGAAAPETPQQRKERTLDALVRQLDLLTRANPLLLVFEDAHWSDATTLDLLQRVVALIASRPALLIVTARPELELQWSSEPHVATVALGPLPPDQSAVLIEQLAGRGRLQADVIQDVVDRTDGVPLYIEELTKAILEVQEQSTQRLMQRVLRHNPAIPVPLHASLLTRLDRLGPARSIAELAAALGREFSYELLAAVADVPEEELRTAVNRLVQSGLLIETRASPQTSYVFKHALVQDAAYETMLRAKRVKLHERIAAVLEGVFPESLATHPEIVAHHCSEAGMVGKAVQYWLSAGYRAMAQWAMVEVIARLERGLGLLPKLPDSPERHALELKFELARGKALIATRGYAEASTGAAFSRAHELCTLLGSPPEVLAVLHGEWTHALLRGDMAAASARAAAVLRNGEERADPLWLLMGCRLSGVTCFPAGEFEAGRRHLERGLALFDPARRPLYEKFTVDDPRVVMRAYLAYIALALGDAHQAQAHCEAALDEARSLRQPYSIAHALIAATYVALYLGRPERAEASLTQLVALADEQRIAYYAAFGTLFRGLSLLTAGDAPAAEEWLQRGIEAYRATSSTLYIPSFLLWLAQAQHCLRRETRALELVGEALELATQTGMCNDLADMYRLRGELQCLLGQPDKGVESLHAALALAARQDAKWAALKAATALARELHSRGERAQARELLARSHQAVQEGHDLAAYREASALLTAL